MALRASIWFSAAWLVMGLSSACSTVDSSRSSLHERYSADQWVVVVREDEVEIRGLLGPQTVTVPSAAIQRLDEGAFEVDLEKVASQLRELGSLELAGLIKNRGVKKIAFDRVGDAALRARLDGDADSALVLSREQMRAPAGYRERDPSLMERYSPTRF
jgi:hypothetical protein